MSPVSPALAGRYFTTSVIWEVMQDTKDSPNPADRLANPRHVINKMFTGAFSHNLRGTISLQLRKHHCSDGVLHMPSCLMTARQLSY